MFKNKWLKASQRNNHKFYTKMQKVLLPNGQITGAVTIERERIDRILIAISKALCYHETKGQKLYLGDWWVGSTVFRYSNLSFPPEIGLLERISNDFTSLNKMNYPGMNLKGENLDAFFYQRIFQPYNITFRLVFYFSLEFICICRNPSNKNPTLLQ
jgi:hypothetical protein